MSQDPRVDPPTDPQVDLPVTSYAVLGLLTFGDELTGYELKQRADMTLRFYWVAPAMSQIYSELTRLTELGLVAPTVSAGEGRATTTYRITESGRDALHGWTDHTPIGFPVLKHNVLLRLLVGHAMEPERIVDMLHEYDDELAAARRDLRGVRDSLRGADAPGEAFFFPSVVAEWGLDYFTAESRHTRKALARLAEPATPTRAGSTEEA